MVNQQEIDKEILLNEEKSLEQLLVDKNYKITSLTINKMIEKIMILNKYESESTGREILRQMLINDKDINKYLDDKSVKIKENYNNMVLTNLKRLMESERKSYNELMKPFRDKENINKHMTLNEKSEILFYKLTRQKTKTEKLKEKLDDELMLRSFYNTKEGLIERLDSSDCLKIKNEELIEKGKVLIEDSTYNLMAILDTLKAGKKSVIKLKSEKQEIVEDISKDEHDQSTGVYNKKRNQASKLTNDINIIHDEGLISLEDAEDLEAEIVEYTKDVNEKNHFRNFYKDISRVYSRRIKVMSNIIIKINQGLSFKVAYEEARMFVQNDTAFTKYEKIRKDQYNENTEEFFSFKFPHKENNLQTIDHSKKDMDYNVMISEGISKIDSFLSKIPQAYK